MSEKIDLNELSTAARVLDDGDLMIQNHEVLALVRAVRAARAYYSHVEGGGMCNHTISLPDGREVCSIVEDAALALAPFTDSNDGAEGK